MHYKIQYGRLTSLLFFIGIIFSGCKEEKSFEQYYPTRELLPSCNGLVVRHTWYSLGYNRQHKQANWVYYELKDRGPSVAKRSDRFSVDPKLKQICATPQDYTKCGYDRGHLCPAADMAFDSIAMRETFYMSNMSPPVPAFTRGIWTRLEELFRNRAEKEPFFLATGPVFKNNT